MEWYGYFYLSILCEFIKHIVLYPDILVCHFLYVMVLHERYLFFIITADSTTIYTSSAK